MTRAFRLLMIGAMYENGGNTVHRFLDGHPSLFVYPFESQPGTRLVNDALSGMFPAKYRWPVFALDATPREDYQAIIDEECKVRSLTPHVSKFRHVDFDFSDEERRALYEREISQIGRSTGNNLEAFFRSTFEAWKNHRRSGKEQVYVGYSPIITVDAERILADLPEAHVLHVVRNPWSAYADTCKRPLPLSLSKYLLAWSVCQYHALLFRELHPGRVHIVRAEDVMQDSHAALGAICRAMGLEPDAALEKPTWNGEPLQEIYPWGTIRTPTPEQNHRTARELGAEQIEEIRTRARPYLDAFGYESFL